MFYSYSLLADLNQVSDQRQLSLQVRPGSAWILGLDRTGSASYQCGLLPFFSDLIAQIWLPGRVLGWEVERVGMGTVVF
jgi:hypothetical protein